MNQPTILYNDCGSGDCNCGCPRATLSEDGQVEIFHPEDPSKGKVVMTKDEAKRMFSSASSIINLL
jgi:hypothetical protein